MPLLTVFPDAPIFSPLVATLFLLVFIITWAILLRYHRIAFILSVFIIAISLISITERYYDFKTALHFPFEYLTFLTFDPLAYECSTSFLLLAIVFIIFNRTKLRAVHLVVVSFLLWMVLSIAQLSILYYIFFQPGIYTRADFSLSFPTTMGLIYIVSLYAIFIYFHVWRLYRYAFSRWVIVSMIFIGITGGYATWKSAKNLENAYFRYLSKEIAVTLKGVLIEYIAEKVDVSQRILWLLENPTEENEKNWKSEASVYFQQNRELLVILGYAPSVDKIWEIREGKSDEYEHRLFNLLEKVDNKSIIIDPQPITPSIVISNKNGDSDPWMAYYIDLNKAMSRLIGVALENKAGISISWGPHILFFKHPNDQKYRGLYGAKAFVPITDPPIVIEVWPTTEQYTFLKTPLPNLILAFNLSALGLAFVILYYAELARLKGDQYRKAEAEKMTFFANVSHEIRTQLQGILGTGSILEKTSLNEKQQRMVNIIKASGNVLQRLLNDLLDVTRFELGRMKLNITPTNVMQSLRDVVNLMTPKAESKGLNLTLKIEPNIPHVIYIDNDRFEQIISNLLSNAIKFTKKGSITVSMHQNILEDNNKTMLIVSVADTGIGIPAADMKRIFEKFYQIQSSQNNAIEGTGLGLPISKTLAEYMQGTLTCESAPDKGSIFTLTLPVEFEAKKKIEI
jgi:signal transduction histidine kinase